MYSAMAGVHGVVPLLTQMGTASCMVLAPEECFAHRTAPEPWSRDDADLVPENIHRLRVLTVPGEGLGYKKWVNG